jgi:hypothetical protein
VSWISSPSFTLWSATWVNLFYFVFYSIASYINIRSSYHFFNFLRFSSKNDKSSAWYSDCRRLCSYWLRAAKLVLDYLLCSSDLYISIILSCSFIYCVIWIMSFSLSYFLNSTKDYKNLNKCS